MNKCYEHNKKTECGCLVSMALVVAMLSAPGSSIAMTRTWSGGGVGALASTPSNWVNGAKPEADDDIVLNADTSKNMTWDLDIPVQSWAQVGYVGTVTIQTFYPGKGSFTNFTILGDCIISNGLWTHSGPAGEVNRLKASIGGDLTIGPNGAIDVSGKGFWGRSGPGYVPVYYSGSHGGRAAAGSGPCYGLIASPSNHGSGGLDAAGGGSIWLTVAGEVINDGLVCADMQDSGSYRGAGGSIWVIAGALTGTGTFRAKSSGPFPGGGGRIALVVTNEGASCSDFMGSIQATGYNAGTIYLENPGDSPGKGHLIVDNDGGPVAKGHNSFTDINGIAPVTYEFSRITLTNGAALNALAGNTLILTNTVLIGNSLAVGANGIWASGGALIVPPVFAYSNLFIGINATNSTFQPTLLTIGTNAEFIVNYPHALTGEVIVAAGGKMTHTANTTVESYKLDLDLIGSLTVQPGGSIDVSTKGFQNKSGFGAWGSHGGKGQHKPNAGRCYGSIVAPTNLGSGGEQTFGGGAIRLRVSDTLRNDGLIASKGTGGWYGAAGGSIWATVGTLSGSGAFTVHGGSGGGGRISLVVTNAGADFTLFTGTLNAAGFGAGTIYRQCAEDRPGRGIVLVDNGGTAGFTDVPSYTNALPGEAAWATFTVTNAAKLWLVDDFTVGDIWLSKANVVLDLGGHTLTVKTREHPLGPGTVVNKGAIVWAGTPPGVLIILK